MVLGFGSIGKLNLHPEKEGRWFHSWQIQHMTRHHAQYQLAPTANGMEPNPCGPSKYSLFSSQATLPSQRQHMLQLNTVEEPVGWFSSYFTLLSGGKFFPLYFHPFEFQTSLDCNMYVRFPHWISPPASCGGKARTLGRAINFRNNNVKIPTKSNINFAEKNISISQIYP